MAALSHKGGPHLSAHGVLFLCILLYLNRRMCSTMSMGEWRIHVPPLLFLSSLDSHFKIGFSVSNPIHSVIPVQYV